MNFLVTGAAGFVGSHVCMKLKMQGHNVLGVDNFSGYYSPDLKKSRVTSLLTPMGITVQNLDLTQLAQVGELLAKSNFDVVIHLAAQPGIRTPLERSREYIDNNVVGFTNMLQICVQNQISKFIYASSSSVYGNSTSESFTESDNSIKPVSIYGATKLSNEILASAYVQNSHTKARGLRFFTVYGPWGRPDMAYFRLIAAGLNRTTFGLYGDGAVRRDFTFIDDISNLLVRLTSDLDNYKSGYSDVVNIGGGAPSSMRDLIEIVNDELGLRIQVQGQPENLKDSKFTSANTESLISKAGPYSFTSLREGIKATVSWANSERIRPQLNAWVNSSS